MEGEDYIEFEPTKLKITEAVAEENYKFWKEKDTIPDTPTTEHLEVLRQVNNMFGAHTFAGERTNKDKPDESFTPLFKIFNYNEQTGLFEDNGDCGLKCDRILQGDGQHLGTARKLGLDKFVFSYLGGHSPYHRETDKVPITPFGLFIKPESFAHAHGSPCDRDHVKNTTVKEAELDKYFLTQERLQEVVANRIMKSPYNGDVWKYYGTPEGYEDEQFREEHWKSTGEYCYYMKVKPEHIEAILWPTWNERMHEGREYEDTFRDLVFSFANTFSNINVVLYRPYSAPITMDNWNERNLREFRRNLVEASLLAQQYRQATGEFPETIDLAREHFN